MIIIGQVTGKESLEKFFEVAVKANQTIEPNYLIKPDKQAWVLTSTNRHVFKSMNFGMVPFWSKRPLFHYEAPVEGESVREPDETKFKKRIILHPSFRKPIRENRCIIPADYIIVESQSGQRILIKSIEEKPFILAGVFDSWKANITDPDLYEGFSLLTIPASGDLFKTGIQRLPLILGNGRMKTWLRRETPLTDITALMQLNDTKNLDAWPVDSLKIELGINSKEITRPTGEHLLEIKKSDFGSELGKLIRFRHR